MFETLILPHVDLKGWVRNTLDLREENMKLVSSLKIIDADSAVLRNFNNKLLILPHNNYLDINITQCDIPYVRFNSTMGHMHMNMHTNVTNIEELTHNDKFILSYETDNRRGTTCMCCGAMIQLTQGQVHICVQKQYDSHTEAMKHQFTPLIEIN